MSSWYKLYKKSNSDYAFYDLWDKISEAKIDIINEFINKKTVSQPWNPVKFSKLKRIWQDYTRLGIVRDAKGMQEIVNQVVNNFARLYANTILAGHTGINPKEELEPMGFEEFSEDQWDDFADWIIMSEDRGMRISDYAIDKLEHYVLQMMQTTDPEEQLLLVDKLLQVSHMRNDLANIFIEGGSRSLDELSYE